MLSSVSTSLYVSFDVSKVINMRPLDEPSVAQFFKAFETGVKNQMMNVLRFQEQGPKEGKVSNGNGVDASHSLTEIQVLIYVSTNAIHFNELPPNYLSVASSRIAMTRTLQDLAVNTPVSEMQILTIVSEIGTHLNKSYNSHIYD